MHLDARYDYLEMKITNLYSFKRCIEHLEALRELLQFQESRSKRGNKISALRDDLVTAQLEESAWRERCEHLELQKSHVLEQIEKCEKAEDPREQISVL